MTERPRGAVARTADSFAIGASSLDWDGTSLTIRIDERSFPGMARIKGTVRVHPQAVTGQSFTLDAPGRHHWWPIAPSSRVEVALQQPGLSWTGGGYFDTNAGTEPLETGFRSWNWSRAATRSGWERNREDTFRNGWPKKVFPSCRWE